MNAFLLFNLSIGTQTFQNYIWFLRLYYFHHFYLQIFKFNELRKRALTNLALELSEVVGSYYSVDLPFNFTVDPSLETGHVDQRATALALAWRYQRVLLISIVT